MLEGTASAVSNSVGLEAFFSTTSSQRIGALKCMYEVTYMYHIILTTLFKNIPVYKQTKQKIYGSFGETHEKKCKLI